MDADERMRKAAGRPQRRKPTPAEHRERRAGVEDLNEVVDSAARFLEARPRSVTEVRRKLTRLGYQAALVDAAIVRLSEFGYLDDDAFARAWVESRDRAKPRGEHALKRELQLKGVDRTLVERVLDERRDTARVAAQVDDVEYANPDDAAAERLLRRKLAPILRETDPRRRRQRAYALLARSGFGPDVCGTVTKRVLDDAAADPDDEDGDEGVTEV